MPGPKRNRRERTDEWASIKQWTIWPEQELYEAIRPLVLYHETAGERAKEIDVPQRTLARKADEFEKYGMASLFPSEEQGGARETSKTLPEEIRQLIVNLHAEAPSMSWREIAEVCYIRYGRKPSHHSVKHIATSGLLPSPQARRYQPWHLIADPAERKLAVIRLHSEGWSIVSPAICGRIMAANRQLYGLQRPPHSPPRPKLEMPFKAARRHEFWSADIRYIEEHLLPDPRPVYVITIFENFSRAVLSSAISASYKSANRCITLSWLQWLASS